jgi:hypothetical protein
MRFKVGDIVRLKFGATLMTVSKPFESPEGREMVKPREHRAAFISILCKPLSALCSELA